MSSDLPYVDEHAVTIAAPRDRVWAALRQYATTSIGVPGGHVLATRHMLRAVRRLSLAER